MRHFFDWYYEQRQPEQPWLILGKGPSFDRRQDYSLGDFKLLSLNHAVRELPVTAAHVIDIDVLDACPEAFKKNAGILVMPWYPHVRNSVGDKTLEQWAADIPLLKSLNAQGRLCWYDLRTSKRRHGDRPVIQATWFSAEAALSLLALAGARTVRSLGVDGGASYGKAFDDLKGVTLLANSHASFDRQFDSIAQIILKTGVDFAPLTLDSPVRVYVGSEEPQMLAVKVLEYSIRRHASMTVEVMPLHRADIRFPMPRDARNKPRTPFSFLRFTIPQLAGYRGRAIYLDSDMLVFKDIRQLWSLPFAGAQLLAAREPGDSARKPQFSVMLLDCDQLRWTPESVVGLLDSGTLTYEQLMHEMALTPAVSAAIDPAWNSLERYQPEQTALLHYTDMDRQPWVSTRNPHGHLWVEALLQAIAGGFIDEALVREHVERGWVRPSLLWQVRRRKARLGPLQRARARFLDRKFVAPYRQLLT